MTNALLSSENLPEDNENIEIQYNIEGLDLIRRLMKVRQNTIAPMEQEPSNIRRISATNFKLARLQLSRMNKAMLEGSLPAFNNALMYLSAAVPRLKGAGVETSPENMIARLNWESAYVDALEDVYKNLVAGITPANFMKTKLKEYGKEIKWLEGNTMSIQKAKPDEIVQIKKMMGNDAHLFVNAWRISAPDKNSKFRKYLQSHDIMNTNMLWHGSASMNFISILEHGLSVKRSNYGLFGNGLYFAPSFDKSRNYCSVPDAYWRGGSDETAFLAIAEVATGKQFDVYDYAVKAQPSGYDSVWAHAGNMLHRDEVIVYDSNACNIRYIVETR